MLSSQEGLAGRGLSGGLADAICGVVSVPGC